MKYLLKMIAAAMLVLSAAFMFCICIAYYWLLYPVYHFRWHAEPWAWIPRGWADFTLEISTFWRGAEGPLFYPGWTNGLVAEQAHDRIHKHFATWIAYCKTTPKENWY